MKFFCYIVAQGIMVSREASRGKIENLAPVQIRVAALLRSLQARNATAAINFQRMDRVKFHWIKLNTKIKN